MVACKFTKMSIYVRGFVSFLLIQIFVRVLAIQLIGLKCGSVQILFSVNPFTAKCGQRKISTKFPNYIFENFDKQIASCEITGRELSFEWSHHRITSAYSSLQTKNTQLFWEKFNVLDCSWSLRFFSTCHVLNQ